MNNRILKKHGKTGRHKGATKAVRSKVRQDEGAHTEEDHSESDEAEALQAIPILGAGVGAAMNASMLRDVGWAARRSFQEHWLMENGKIVLSGE